MVGPKGEQRWLECALKPLFPPTGSPCATQLEYPSKRRRSGEPWGTASENQREQPNCAKLFSGTEPAGASELSGGRSRRDFKPSVRVLDQQRWPDLERLGKSG